jgi:hypothetical protein
MTIRGARRMDTENLPGSNYIGDHLSIGFSVRASQHQPRGGARAMCIVHDGSLSDPGLLRWSRKIGQVLKLGLPWLEDGPDDGQAEAIFGGFQGEGGS